MPIRKFHNSRYHSCHNVTIALNCRMRLHAGTSLWLQAKDSERQLNTRHRNTLRE